VRPRPRRRPVITGLRPRSRPQTNGNAKATVTSSPNHTTRTQDPCNIGFPSQKFNQGCLTRLISLGDHRVTDRLTAWNYVLGSKSLRHGETSDCPRLTLASYIQMRLRGQMERGQGHNTNKAEASCSEAEAKAGFSGL